MTEKWQCVTCGAAAADLPADMRIGDECVYCSMGITPGQEHELEDDCQPMFATQEDLDEWKDKH